jgi:hypothetical protein
MLRSAIVLDRAERFQGRNRGTYVTHGLNHKTHEDVS